MLQDQAQRLQRQLATDPSPATFHAVGLWHLAWQGGESSARKAQEYLARARRLSPADAAVLNDLAAAVFALGRARSDPEASIAALDLAVEAAERGDVAAEFNVAFLAGHLGLTQVARASWDRYLAADDHSDWAEEARARLATVAAPAPSWTPDPQAMREELLDRRLSAWGEARLAGRSGTAEREALASETASYERIGRDRTAMRCLRAVTETAAGAHRLRTEHLASGLARYGRARQSFLQGQYAEAAEAFTAAAGDLEGSGCPLDAWARSWAASAEINSSGDASPRRRITELQRHDLAGLTALQARLHWLRGVLELRTSRLAAALADFRAAARLYEAAGERENLAAMLALEAETFYFLGQGSEAWRLRLRAMEELAGRPESLRLHNLLLESGMAALESGYLRAGRLLFDEALARAVRDPARRAELLVWRARSSRAAGAPADVATDLVRAGREVDRVPDERLRERLAHEVLEASVLLEREDSGSNLQALSESIAYYRRQALGIKLPPLLVRRAAARWRLGDPAGAERDLAAAIEEHERRGQGLAAEELRRGQLVEARQVYAAMAWFQWEARRRPDLALEAVERWRLRLFRGGAETRRCTAQDLAAGVANLPEKEVLVEYWTSGPRLFIAVAHRGGFEFFTRLVPDLQERVRELVERITAMDPDAEIQPLSESLYSSLIAPIEDALPPGAALILVPDATLEALPFAALRRPGGGRYLVETNVLSFTPSSCLYLLGEPVPSAGARDGVVLVADPAFDDRLFPGLARLPGALEEVAALRPIYPEARTLIGEEVGREALLAAWEKADILHFAGHAVANPDDPLLSHLPLASSVGGASAALALFARDLYEQPPLGPRLVVLSACGTAETARETPGNVSALAHAFLAAGTQTVIASQWAVEDARAPELMVAFHGDLGRLEAAAALRDAQRRMVGSDELPFRWAGYRTLVGARYGHQQP